VGAVEVVVGIVVVVVEVVVVVDVVVDVVVVVVGSSATTSKDEFTLHRGASPDCATSAYAVKVVSAVKVPVKEPFTGVMPVAIVKPPGPKQVNSEVRAIGPAGSGICDGGAGEVLGGVGCDCRRGRLRVRGAFRRDHHAAYRDEAEEANCNCRAESSGRGHRLRFLLASPGSSAEPVPRIVSV
jgi:hypothetical protein